jgi:hypothetical protein
MPDSDHWSASVLLRWVLTRDSDAVLSMVNDYGGSVVDGDNVCRTQPQTWDDVGQPCVIDDSLPTEKRAREAVLRSRVLLPAREEIYTRLTRGELDGWARPNGSGNLVKIEPIQWVGLRIRAFEGHDIAVPVDSEQNPLPLGQPLFDYVSGLVPATETPTVWPDPLFSAAQALHLWPPGPIDQVSHACPPITSRAEGPAVDLNGFDPPPGWGASRRRGRGRPPKKRDETERAMRAEYAERHQELRDSTEDALAAEFGVSRTTARNARERILDGIVSNSGTE